MRYEVMLQLFFATFLAVFFCCLSIPGYCIVQSPSDPPFSFHPDSLEVLDSTNFLFFENTQTQEIMVIQPGQDVLVLHKKARSVKGIYKGVKEGAIRVESKKGMKEIPIAGIEKIQIRSSLGLRIASVLSATLGAVCIGIAAVITAIAINYWILYSGSLLVLVAIPFILLFAISCLLVSKHVEGKMLHLRRHWHIRSSIPRD